MSKMKHTLCYMAVLVGFAACTQEDISTLPDGGQPLTLTDHSRRCGHPCHRGWRLDSG